MKVLVTGGGGFLGGAIVRRCAAHGDEVQACRAATIPSCKSSGAA